MRSLQNMSTNPTSVVLEIPLGTVNLMSSLEGELSVFANFDLGYVNYYFRRNQNYPPTKGKNAPLTAKMLSLSPEVDEYKGQDQFHIAKLLTRHNLRPPSNIREVLALGALLPKPEKDQESRFAIYAPELNGGVEGRFIRIRTTPLWVSGYEFHRRRWNGWGITLATLRHEKKCLHDYQWIGFAEG